MARQICQKFVYKHAIYLIISSITTNETAIACFRVISINCAYCISLALLLFNNCVRNLLINSDTPKSSNAYGGP